MPPMQAGKPYILPTNPTMKESKSNPDFLKKKNVHLEEDSISIKKLEKDEIKNLYLNLQQARYLHTCYVVLCNT